MSRLLHRLLYQLLPLPLYLRVVSSMLFLSLKLGVGRNSRATEYIFHLPKLIGKGGVAIDIGANLGYYSRPMSDIVGSTGCIHSVEPVPVIYDVLRKNIGGRKNVELYNVALGTESRQITMSNSSVAECGYFGTGQNEVGGGTNAGAIEFEARMCRGSELFRDLPKIDLIKCDIEGYETVVIPELRSLIERHRPVVLIESGGENREQIIELFTELRYDGFSLEMGEEVPLQKSSDKDIIFRPKR